MRIVGAVPTYADSPLDGLWLELARHHDVTLWGEGRPGYRRHTPLRELAADADLVLLADPVSKGSEWWDTRGVRARVATVFVDSCYDFGSRAAWATRQGVGLVLLRAKDDVAKYQAALPHAQVAWLPFGFDPRVFDDMGEPKRHDVALFGHLGSHTYPVRERVRAALLSQESFSVFDGCVRGDEPPRLTGWAYAREIGRARVAVATSNVHGHVVQKYYEIPACGTALVAERARHGFGELLAPGVHLEVFDDPASVVDVVGRLLDDDARRAELTHAGYRHVHAHHTNAHRVAMLETLLGWRHPAEASRHTHS